MEKELLPYFGTIIYQEFNKDFIWNKMEFNQYLVRLDNSDGTFLINRKDDLEQALIGAKIQYNLNESRNQISKYRITAYEEYKVAKDKMIKELIRQRKTR